jgi:hypothetical protein
MTDSRPDTLAHIARVREHLDLVMAALTRRAILHDASKLVEPEKSAFDALDAEPILFGSPAYSHALYRLRDALDHHYAHNRHHPEYHPGGIDDMTLIDLIEMLCDWKAASERHEAGNITASIAINADRFDIHPQLRSVLENTVAELWPEHSGGEAT